VFRDVPRLADPGAFPAWLYQVARRRAFRHLRKRRPPLCALDGIDVPAENGDDVDLTAEDAEAVHAALDLLPEDHREVLLLRFIEQMSYQDIARVVGCPVGTVRSRIHHAKRALRRALETRSPHE
jgi:RNA polymerase sigma-70 factor (ECF subfamily)